MKLLVIGKLDSQVSEAVGIARKNGADVAHVSDTEAALTHLCAGKGADLAMVDVTLDVGGLIAALKQERINVPVIGYGTENNSKAAVAAIKAGAKEYLPLPPDEQLIAAILEAIAEDSRVMICTSPAMQKVVEIADRVASSDASVLITGGSGTGKEVMARYIHNKSNRSKEAFVSVNCAAIPDNLLESELFGHEKGAFTGATHKRIGKFEESSNGTLLLDEISEMDARLQAKLLRAIQEQEIDRVGGTKPIKLNLRILATSNRDLRKEVAAGNFREDLYFRLNVINLDLPPLRERKEDIGKFAGHFAEKYAEANGMEPLAISKETMKKLEDYSWPGNVRELENTMHRAVLLSTGKEIEADAIHLSGETNDSADAVQSEAGKAAQTTTSPDSSSDGLDSLVGQTVESVERDLILKTVDHCLGNRTHAANILGISIRTLRNKLKAYEEGMKAG